VQAEKLAVEVPAREDIARVHRDGRKTVNSHDCSFVDRTRGFNADTARRDHDDRARFRSVRHMNEDALRRISAALEPDTLDALARLAGADFTTVMLELSRRRAEETKPSDIMRRYGMDRFLQPGAIDLAMLRHAEDVDDRLGQSIGCAWPRVSASCARNGTRAASRHISSCSAS
jgi:hypothetical protein